MAFYLLQEDGVSRIALEDLSGFIILEEEGGATPSPPPRLLLVLGVGE